ncbi:unnamed protein product [Prorocentrum cordatum]|uniref:Uncharacterized protein n=1 Tax=Prorocentrum cordatum TaxID=2364126 RepID=A0ABN9PKK9_9DINO|nr:unnamed protein product [Polarella glacialis]
MLAQAQAWLIWPANCGSGRDDKGQATQPARGMAPACQTAQPAAEPRPGSGGKRTSAEGLLASGCGPQGLPALGAGHAGAAGRPRHHGPCWRGPAARSRLLCALDPAEPKGLAKRGGGPALPEGPPPLPRSPAIVGDSEWGALILETFFVPRSARAQLRPEGAAGDGPGASDKAAQAILRSVLPVPPQGAPARRMPLRRRLRRSSSA